MFVSDIKPTRNITTPDNTEFTSDACDRVASDGGSNLLDRTNRRKTAPPTSIGAETNANGKIPASVVIHGTARQPETKPPSPNRCATQFGFHRISSVAGNAEKDPVMRNATVSISQPEPSLALNRCSRFGR